ncbi:MAG TPA: hypothetical protein PKH24_08655 [Sedimentisphaerales bacterium]|jgi:hypothetical protein|nr:hypothetical protein [Sedimentisphaerales bacterium]HNU28835.1 hypothetical protein [Sedimentisphaerales bacterium]
MKKTHIGVIVLCAVLCVGLAGIAIANSAVDGDEPAMMVSPSVIVLAKVSIITVHTNIALSAVVPGTIALDGVEATGVFADSLGHLVAKFAIADLDLAPGQVTLTLTGDFKSGEDFSATDDVIVR